MLFRGEAGERVEHVGVVIRAAFHGPGFHGVGHHVGHVGIEASAEIDGGAQRLVHGLGQIAPHGLVVEDVAPVVFGGIGMGFGRRGVSPRDVFRVMTPRGNGKYGMAAAGVGRTHANSLKKMSARRGRCLWKKRGVPRRISLWKPLRERR